MKQDNKLDAESNKQTHDGLIAVTSNGLK